MAKKKQPKLSKKQEIEKDFILNKDVFINGVLDIANEYTEKQNKLLAEYKTVINLEKSENK